MALSTEVVPAKKKLYTVTRNRFKVNGEFIKQMDINQTVKYLGLKFAIDGVTKCCTYVLNEQLQRIKRAPLKPQQKMKIIRTYLIPRYIAYYENPSINRRILKEADKKIRAAIKKILHLNIHCSNAIFYAPMKSGGQGLFCSETTIPIIIANRLEKLRDNDNLREILNKFLIFVLKHHKLKHYI